MTRSFIISTIANRDIEEIADYLAENRGFETSDRFIKGMTDRLT
jgi:plasmid stabilization system protein ParE